MTLRHFALLLTTLGVSLVPALARAHFLWATLEPNSKTLAVGLTEHPGEAPLPLEGRLPEFKAFSKTEKSFPLRADGNWLKGAVKDECVAIGLDYGVLDRSAQWRGIYRLYYFAKAAANPAASAIKLGLPVEVTVTSADEQKSTVTVLKDGKPAASAELVAVAPDGTVTFEGKTVADGTASIPASGPVAVRAMVTENKKGSLDGKSYDLVRSYCTLTIPAPQRRLTSMIRDAFGDNHDVVGRTAFNRTLMSGKLTKPQLVDHLQQRALIHDEIDRILGGSSAKPMPYGDAQKQVSTLLRQDLSAMGSRWPLASEAWPMTREFILEIRNSEKNGPYYALGVMHVYYGGITHGGRQIGAKIHETLNVDLTYYRKSDGYDPYVRIVNTITDPTAQQEMIRGGKAAYKYIIAVSDLESFKG